MTPLPWQYLEYEFISLVLIPAMILIPAYVYWKICNLWTKE